MSPQHVAANELRRKFKEVVADIAERRTEDIADTTRFAEDLGIDSLMLSRGRRLVRDVDFEEGEWSAYEKDWAAQDQGMLPVSPEGSGQPFGRRP